MTENYTDINAKTVDGWVKEGWQWGVPMTHEAFIAAQNGDWQMLLTPTKSVPRDWFLDDFHGKKVFGLAAGGGQQMPLLTALGAECTVLDYSPAQLESERKVAERENYDITIIRGDMTKPLPFADNTFDFIVHPVSNCYVEEVEPIWKECCRILKPGGRLIAGLDNGINYIVSDDEHQIVNSLPYNPLKQPELMASLDIADSGIQFSHTIEEQIRGQLKAGFTLVDVYEDTNGEGYLHELNIPSFWATQSVK